MPTNIIFLSIIQCCHSREGGNLDLDQSRHYIGSIEYDTNTDWIPAFAGMTGGF